MKYHAITQCEAIIEAFKALGGNRTISEIEVWVIRKYGALWKDFGTPMADMVPVELGGNRTSTVARRKRILKRVGIGVYALAT